MAGCVAASAEVTRALLEGKADPNVVTLPVDCRRTPLHAAAAQGAAEVSARAGAGCGERRTGAQAARIAQVVAILLEANAEFDAVTSLKETALHLVRRCALGAPRPPDAVRCRPGCRERLH